MIDVKSFMSTPPTFVVDELRTTAARENSRHGHTQT